MNVDWALVAANPTDLDCESAKNWQILSISMIATVIITQPVSWYSFYCPTDGKRLSRPRHYSKGMQPMPKAVYCNGCCDKRKHLWCDWNRDPLTLQSDAMTTRPLQLACWSPSAYRWRWDRQTVKHKNTFNGLFSSKNLESWNEKGKPPWILKRQEVMGFWNGSDTGQTTYKQSALHSR